MGFDSFFRMSLCSFLVNFFQFSFVLASSWAEDTDASMNSQFISPEIGGLFSGFSPLLLFAFSGTFVLFVRGRRSGEGTSFLWQYWELILQWSGMLSTKGTSDCEDKRVLFSLCELIWP